MFCYEASRYPESKTRALESFGCKERIEDFGAYRHRNSVSAIMNCDAHFSTSTAVNVPGTDIYGRVRRRSFRCVPHEIGKHLAELTWMSHNRRHRLGIDY